MSTISKVEQEVNKIRLGIYEKTKDMNPEQLSEYYRKSTEATVKKYGFKIVANTKDTANKQRQV
jgi:hypothetical protein